MRLLESRNYEGKSAIMLSIEHEREEITKYLLENYPDIDLERKILKMVTVHFHIACLKSDVETV